MARCPFATWKELTGPSSGFAGGPFRIVHHTTESSSLDSAFAAFLANRSDPHFTVHATAIFQHIDTDQFARSLRHTPPAIETNRASAIQIEVVGFAHLPKGPDALRNVARLCRWIEATHGVPRIWPNGHPTVAVNGQDPGGENRDATTWATSGGHYGHCHVPENSHWDPGYTLDEVNFLQGADFDKEFRAYLSDQGTLLEDLLPPADQAGLRKAVSTMPDHAVVDQFP
jgi:hypothetical protein